MILDPRRAEENLQADLAKVRTAVRMRLGIVAGIVIVGLLQMHFDFAGNADLVALARVFFKTAAPLLGLAAAGVLIVLALGWRDMKRARDVYDSKRFRVPTRKTPP